MSHIVFVNWDRISLSTMARAKSMGHRVTLIWSPALSDFMRREDSEPTIRSCNYSIEINTRSVAELSATLEKVNHQFPINAVINATDATLESTSLACEQLGLQFTSSVGIRNARNKLITRSMLSAAGLTSVRFAHATGPEQLLEAASGLAFPVVIKPVSAHSSILCHQANKPQDLEEVIRTLPRQMSILPNHLLEDLDRGFLVEEFAVGEIISAEIAVLNGRKYRLILSGRTTHSANTCIGLGSSLPAELPLDLSERCYHYAESVCDVLGLNLGVFNIEMAVGSHKPILIEANPRRMGGAMISAFEHASNRNFHEIIIDVHLCKPPRFVDEPFVASVVIRKIMPLREARLPRRFSLDSLNNEELLVDFENYGIFAGAHVYPLQVLGRALVRGHRLDLALTAADRVSDRLEKILGVQLARQTGT